MEIIHRNTWNNRKTSVIVLHEGYALVKVIIYDEEPETAIISNLIVHPTKRNLNYGNELLQAAIKEAKANDCTDIILHTNPKSWIAEWYKRKGFKGYYVNNKYEMKYEENSN